MSGQRPLSTSNNKQPPRVLRLEHLDADLLGELLGRFGLELVVLDPGSHIKGSYWGDEEAGLIDHRILVRCDTPIHSVLHEACHYICMSPDRRRQLDTDAGGGYDEENAVCYLQVLLADHLSGCSSAQMMSDMDAWGYSFRLGSTQAWFEQDAEDALAWLQQKELVDLEARVLWKLRTC